MSMFVTERRLYNDMEWDEYTRLPAHSFSSLRNAGPITPSEGMRFGTCVHQYLLEPNQYSGEWRREVKAVAYVLAPLLNGIKYMPEVAMTANFRHQDLVMPVRGRCDVLVPGKLIIDFKVSKMDIVKAINYFGYHDQQSGYAAMANVKRAMIISINPVTLKPTVMNIPLVYDWWEQQITSRGVRV